MSIRNLRKLAKRYLPQWVLRVVTPLYTACKIWRVQVTKYTVNYNEDALITAHYPTFMRDERFVKYYDQARRDGLCGADIRWRAHVAVWAAERGKHLDGDFVECGVARGFLSKIIVDYLDFEGLPKTFYLMDTYEGLAEKYLTEKEKQLGRHGGGYEPSFEMVKQTFGSYKNVKIIKGAIPETLPLVTSKKIAYLSIDMNNVTAEIAAAEYFWDKMVSGAAMVLDDYGHIGFEEQQYGFNDFAKRKGVPILCLPTGQGVIQKP